MVAEMFCYQDDLQLHSLVPTKVTVIVNHFNYSYIYILYL
jgi:hypothetical protein